MTPDELAIFNAAVQIYISRETRKHGRKDSDLRFEATEKAALRFQAADEARALYQHIVDMEPRRIDMPEARPVIETLERHRGNVTLAALELGITNGSVYKRVRSVDPHYFVNRGVTRGLGRKRIVSDSTQ